MLHGECIDWAPLLFKTGRAHAVLELHGGGKSLWSGGTCLRHFIRAPFISWPHPSPTHPSHPKPFLLFLLLSPSPIPSFCLSCSPAPASQLDQFSPCGLCHGSSLLNTFLVHQPKGLPGIFGDTVSIFDRSESSLPFFYQKRKTYKQQK